MNVLVVAPHADDEILGVGGTIARHIHSGDKVYVCIVARGIPPITSKEEHDMCSLEIERAHKFLGVEKTFSLEFPSSMLENVSRFEFNGALCNIVKEVKPDVAYIPFSGDLQKDHQMVAEACMVAMRPKYDYCPKKIYAYETLSETAWSEPSVKNAFIPNAFVDISEFLDKKLQALGEYQSQLDAFPSARSLEAVEALAKFRGALVQCNAAEAFVLIREIF